ncbi:hypothetical protein DFP72DRAFT_933811 [Ephemerocybe angulata]|uniref:C2H2-type domain-containing protein n=1 Tax=Ephemerocybe angulata TaxID=980116 RepID=A0A8H6HBX9_9AGAR|nr:hypothetical protein DFP72DRAFT_933811 [Tulosesus angulatus]
MRIQFLALLSTFVSLACLSSAHHEHSVDSREFVDGLSTGDFPTRDLGDISAREIIGQLRERLERRDRAGTGRWCCPECGKEFKNNVIALGHEMNSGGKHKVYALKRLEHCPWVGKR